MQKLVALAMIAALPVVLTVACDDGGGNSDAPPTPAATEHSVATADDATITRVAQELPREMMASCPSPEPALDALTGEACAAAMREVIASILLELNADYYAIACVGEPPANAARLGLGEGDWRIEAPIDGSFFAVDPARSAGGVDRFERRELAGGFVCAAPAD
jgi:hypothetical protein